MELLPTVWFIAIAVLWTGYLFLEGFDLFDTPMQVAYTRTITAPRFGARSTGKLFGAAYTLLVTDDRGARIPGLFERAQVHRRRRHESPAR